MATLVLGENEVAYSDAHQPGSITAGATTTFQVAQILEKRYHVMEGFYMLRKGKIADYLAAGMGTAIQNLVAGRPNLGNPMHDVAQKIENEFRSFIYANELQKISLAIGAGPISAVAARGISSRRKPNPKGRPAFVDTGLYVQNMRAEVKL